MAEKGKKKSKALIWGIGLMLTSLIVGGGIYAGVQIFKGRKKDEDQVIPVVTTGDLGLGTGNGSSDTNTGTGSSGYQCASPTTYISGAVFPIRKGQNSANVVKLQKALNKILAHNPNRHFASYLKPLTEDGKFGCKTEENLSVISKSIVPGLPAGLTYIKTPKLLNAISAISVAPDVNAMNIIISGLSISDIV